MNSKHVDTGQTVHTGMTVWLNASYTIFTQIFRHLNPGPAEPGFCLCLGFMAKSTQWGHVKHGQLI